MHACESFNIPGNLTGRQQNKTNSAVQIIHKPTGIVIKTQETRSRSQNEKIARRLLADRVEALLNGDQSRAAIKADKARKKRASKIKKSRRKYRELEKDKELAHDGQDIEIKEEGEDYEEDDDTRLQGNDGGRLAQEPS